MTVVTQTPSNQDVRCSRHGSTHLAQMVRVEHGGMGWQCTVTFAGGEEATVGAASLRAASDYPLEAERVRQENL